LEKTPRDKILKFRVTTQERQQILLLSSKEGYRDYSDYLRDLGLQKRMLPGSAISREEQVDLASPPVVLDHEETIAVQNPKKKRKGR